MFFLGTIILIVFSFADVPDRLAIDFLIPVYPNATNYRTFASNGFPDGFGGGSIDFETNDNAQKVIDYYKSKLANGGWEVLGSNYGEVQYPEGVTIYNLFLKKRIGPYVFHVHVSKNNVPPEVEEMKKKEYPYIRELGRRVSILVNH